VLKYKKFGEVSLGNGGGEFREPSVLGYRAAHLGSYAPIFDGGFAALAAHGLN